MFAFTNAFYGPGTGPILMADMERVNFSTLECSRSLTRSIGPRHNGYSTRVFAFTNGFKDHLARGLPWWLTWSVLMSVPWSVRVH